MAVVVRRATAADQDAIRSMIRRARLNPLALHWQRFVVAEVEGELVGVIQVRRLAEGHRELASLVVRPDLRQQGVAARMIDAQLGGDEGEMYTLLDCRFKDHYARWGFRPVDPRSLPRVVARQYRVGRLVMLLASVRARRRIRLVPLKR